MSKFVNTDTWLTCSMGMKPARIVVTSQGKQTFVDKPGATIEDTSGYNFICTKYLGLIGFLAGILLAALCVLFPAVGFLLLLAVTFIGGLGIAGTIGYLVCCSSYGKPRQWQLQHPTVQIEGKHALVSDSKMLCSKADGVVTMHESFSGALWTSLKGDAMHMLNYSMQFLSGYMVGKGSINLFGAARAGGAAGVGSLFSSGLKNMFSPAGLRSLFAAGNYGKAALQTGMLALGYGSTAYTGYNMYKTATDPNLSLGEKAWELGKESLLQVMFVFGAGNVPKGRPSDGGSEGSGTKEEAPKADDAKPTAQGEAKPAEAGGEHNGGMAETETKPELVAENKPPQAESSPPGSTKEPLALPAGRPTTNTLAQIRRMRGKAKWEAGEQYVQELYGSPGQRHYPVPQQGGVTTPGGRFVDAPVDTPNGGVMANEVKTYQQWRTVQGLPQQNSVPLSEHIRQQVLKDVWLKNNVPGYDPRWIFLEAPPSQELGDFLSQNGIIYIIYH